MSTATGEISLDIAVRSGRSTAASQYYRGQLRWFRPHDLDGSGQVCCTVINLGGGDLGGDTYELEAAVQTGARLLLTTQSTPKVYRTPHQLVPQKMAFRLEKDASMEYLLDRLIACQSADCLQDNMVFVEDSSSLVLPEVITLG